jgi:NADH dehydrogenase FAD-containing subunit
MGHLVLVGGGHAQLEALRNLPEIVDRGHRVTLVADSPHHYYSGMGPGLLGGMYEPEELRFDVRHRARSAGAAFLHKAAVAVDPDARTVRLESGESVSYDVVSLCIGSHVATSSLGADDPRVFTVKPIVNLLTTRNRLLEMAEAGGQVRVVVVGGGPAGVEVTGNCWGLITGAGAEARITLACRGRLLDGFPERGRRLARASLEGRGVEILEQAGIERMADGDAHTSEGRSLPYDVGFVATGVRPRDIFSEAGLPTGDSGALLVNPELRSAEYPEVFGGGDCITLEGKELEKVGVHAVDEAPVLCHNLVAALEDGEPSTFRPRSHYMLILNMGDGRGIATKWGLTFDTRMALWLKDRIDRAFMRKYQMS